MSTLVLATTLSQEYPRAEGKRRSIPTLHLSEFEGHDSVPVIMATTRKAVIKQPKAVQRNQTVGFSAGCLYHRRSIDIWICRTRRAVDKGQVSSSAGGMDHYSCYVAAKSVATAEVIVFNDTSVVAASSNNPWDTICKMCQLQYRVVHIQGDVIFSDYVEFFSAPPGLSLDASTLVLTLRCSNSGTYLLRLFGSGIINGQHHPTTGHNSRTQGLFRPAAFGTLVTPSRPNFCYQ